MLSKPIDTSVAIHQVFHKRWSGVAYNSSLPIPREHLLAMAEAARWAPSCFGDQPWRYIICDRYCDPEAWNKAYECLADGNKPWCKHAPVLIISCHDTRFSRNDKPNNYGAHDTGAASVSLCLQAAELGIMTHQMAGFDPDSARELFSIPDRFQPVSMITAGYELDENAIPEEFRERELAPRDRRPLGSSFFAGRWENPLAEDQ